MKFFKRLAVILLTGSILTSKASSQGYVWQSLSASDAVQAVQNFEGNPSLVVSVAQTPSAQVAPAPWIEYVLTAGNYRYTVCAYSHDMFTRSDMTFLLDKPTFYGQPYDPSVLKSQAMSQSAAQAIAQSFMQTHFPHPEVLTQTRVWPKLAYDSTNGNPVFTEDYEVAYFQRAVNGVGGPAECRVTVDTVKGKVIDYSAKSFPLLINMTPGITGNQATASAMNALNIAQGTPKAITGLIVSVPDALGNETLLYGVNFTGIALPTGQTDTTGMSPQNYVATVDAFTGNVVYASTLMNIVGNYKAKETQNFSLIRSKLPSGHNSFIKELHFVWAGQPSNLNYSPICIGKTAYLCAAYLCSYGANITLEPKRNGFIINGMQRRLACSLDSQTYHFNGQTKRMSVKPIQIKGRYYVPLDVAQTVLGGHWGYYEESQTVRYDPQKFLSIKRGSSSGMPMLIVFLVLTSFLNVTYIMFKS